MTMMRPVPLSPTAGQIPGIAVCKPPWEWSRDEVSDWLLHCEREYALDKIDKKRFSMNGKALYILTKQDFLERVPSIGDLLFNHLHLIHDEAQRCRVEHIIAIHRYTPMTRTRNHTRQCSGCKKDAQQPAPLQKPYDPFYVGSSNQNSRDAQQPAPLQKPYDPFYVGSSNQNSRDDFSPSQSVVAPLHLLERTPSPGSSPMAAPSYPTHTQPCNNNLMSQAEDDVEPQNLVMCERKIGMARHAHGHSSTSSPGPDDSVILLGQGSRDVGSHGRRLSVHGNYADSFVDEKLGQTPVMTPADTNCQNGRTKPIKGDSRLLWDFLSNLLTNDLAPNCISWEDQERDMFRIHDAAALAQLWGRQKNRTNMTYEKMSRALRYYYKMKIIEKVKGKRLTYRFVKKPDDIRRGRGSALRCNRLTSIEEPECAVARDSVDILDAQGSDAETACKTENSNCEFQNMEGDNWGNQRHNSNGAVHPYEGIFPKSETGRMVGEPSIGQIGVLQQPPSKCT